VPSSSRIDGLASGLDTTSIITQLMALERAPVTRLQQRIGEHDAAVRSLRAFTTSLDAIRSKAESLSVAAASFVPRTATSSSTAVTATAAAGAATGSISFTVDALAGTHRLVSAGTTAATTDVVATAGSTVTITVGGQDHAVATGDGTLAALVKAINDEGIGVRAQAVQTGSGYRLQLSAVDSGAAAAFTVDTTNLSSTFASGTAVAGTPLALLAQGADARITVGDQAGAYTVTSKGNTFAGVVDGLTFTVSATSAAPVTVTVADDATALTAQVKGFVEAVDAALKAMDEATASGKDGKKGSLANDPSIRALRSRLLNAVTFGVGGSFGSAGRIGIESTRAGGLTFDAAAFAEALADDPEALVAVFRTDDAAAPGIAQRVAAVADSATAKGTGVLATAIESRTTRTRSLQDSIERLDVRLELRRTALQRQFSALESALSSLQSQGDWLANQLPALNASSARR
jgi:flagellar hook-associated protein 2